MSLSERTDPTYISVSEASGLPNELKLIFQNAGEQAHVFHNDGTVKEIPEIDDDVDGKALSRIYLYFPILLDEKAPEEERRKYLTTLELAKKAALYTPGDWVVLAREHTTLGYYWTLYPTKEVSLRKGGTLTVYIRELTTYLPSDRLSFLSIRYDNGTVTSEMPIALRAAPLEIRRFGVEGDLPGMGDSVTLAWECTGADRCWIIPGDVKVDKVGSRSFPVEREVTFMLYAQKGGQDVSCPVHVCPSKGQSNPTADKAEVSYGEKVLLRLGLQGTAHAWVDNGVGRVSGDCSVLPQKSVTTYHIRTDTDEGYEEKTVTVKVLDKLELVYLYAYRKEEGKYRISWMATGAQEFKISCGETVVSKNFKGDADYQGAPGTIRVTARGKHEQQLDQTFQITI